MAEEPMVSVDLTSEMIEVGRQLLEVLDRYKFRARARFWFYFEESERWRLVVASPEARMGGPLLACLRKAVPTDPKTGGTRLARTWANGTFIAGACIYRLPLRRKLPVRRKRASV